jgi:hypothetical protein
VRTVIASILGMVLRASEQVLVLRRLVVLSLSHLPSADTRLHRDMGGRNPDVLNAFAAGSGGLNAIGNDCPW